MKTVFVTFVLVSSLFAVTLSLSCMSCDKAKCGPKPTCKGGQGYTKDVCGCCDVCAKVKGEQCGGYWFHFGRCDAGLTCVLRTNGRLINKGLGQRILPGRCEDDTCAVHKCGLHQTCAVVDGLPKCECPRLCKNKEKPVCGLFNGVEYLNECRLRRYECKTGQRIPFVRGPCKYCAFKGEIYKFGEKIQKKNKCQVCSCAHGRWNCVADPSCKRPMPLLSGELMRCIVPGPRGRDICPRGFMCAYVNTPMGQDGLCVPKPTRKPRSTPPTTETLTKAFKCPLKNCMRCKHGYKVDSNGCRTCQCVKPASQKARPGCPMVECKPCKRGYKVDDRGCQTCQCVKVNICELPKFTGPCRASLRRYYFNKKTGKCSRFLFGGCKSNGNNFETRRECKLKCQM